MNTISVKFEKELWDALVNGNDELFKAFTTKKSLIFGIYTAIVNDCLEDFQEYEPVLDKQSEQFCVLAAKKGAAKILKHMHSTGFAWDETKIIFATLNIDAFPKTSSARAEGAASLLTSQQIECFKHVMENGFLNKEDVKNSLIDICMAYYTIRAQQASTPLAANPWGSEAACGWWHCSTL